VTDFDAPFFIKICGLTTLGDANAAIDAGASAIGLILAASSRHLTVERALAIAEATKGRTVRTLVFRDNDDDFILGALENIGAEAVQIHGPLGEGLLTRLRETNVGIIKALPIGSDEFFEFDERLVDAVLVDGAIPGSGERHSWDDLIERTFDVPVIAAGGLDDGNVASVIADTRVWGVDCASGVESSPGIKDRGKLTHFIDNARGAFRERTTT
jgi:phosphoribosylanthranilate isomerase